MIPGQKSHRPRSPENAERFRRRRTLATSRSVRPRPRAFRSIRQNGRHAQTARSLENPLTGSMNAGGGDAPKWEPQRQQVNNMHRAEQPIEEQERTIARVFIFVIDCD